MDPQQFLATLWGEPLPGKILVWTLPQKRSIWYIHLRTINSNMSRYQDRV